MSVTAVGTVGAGGTNGTAPAASATGESPVVSKALSVATNGIPADDAAAKPDPRTIRQKLQEAVRTAQKRLKDAEAAEKTAEAQLASHRIAAAKDEDLIQDRLAVELRQRDVAIAKQALEEAEQNLLQAPAADHTL